MTFTLVENFFVLESLTFVLIPIDKHLDRCWRQVIQTGFISYQTESLRADELGHRVKDITSGATYHGIIFQDPIEVKEVGDFIDDSFQGYFRIHTPPIYS